MQTWFDVTSHCIVHRLAKPMKELHLGGEVHTEPDLLSDQL